MAFGHLAGGGDRELQHKLALQIGLHRAARVRRAHRSRPCCGRTPARSPPRCARACRCRRGRPCCWHAGRRRCASSPPWFRGPISEPAPVPKPRLALAVVIPPEPAPTLEAISERSAWLSWPTAPCRFLVCPSGVRSTSRRRSASSSLNFSRPEFCAFLRASAVLSTGFGHRDRLDLGLGLGLRHRRRRLGLLLHHQARQALGYRLGRLGQRWQMDKRQDHARTAPAPASPPSPGGADGCCSSGSSSHGSS